MTIRKLMSIVLVLSSFVFLFSCEKNPINTIDTTNTISSFDNTLAFRITWMDYSGRGEAIGNIVSTYNDESSGNYFISMVSGDEDLSTIQALLDSSAETLYVLPYRYVKYVSDKGYLLDLTEEFKDSEDLFYPAVWDLGTVDGSTYGIPWLGHSMCLLYNKNLLNESGINSDSINSLDTLLEAIEMVEEKTDAHGIGLVGADSNDVSWMVNQFIYGFGSTLVSRDGKSITINNEKTKAALEFYKNVLGEHAQPSWKDDSGEEVMSYFRKQEVAFEIQGIWGVTDILKNGSPFEVGVIALDDIGLCAEVGPMMLAIPTTMKNESKVEAIKFIQYMISMDAQEQIMYGEYSPERDAYYPFRTPIRIDMADSQIFQSFPEYLLFIKGFEDPSIDVPVPEWQTIKDSLYESGLHSIMIGETSITEFLQMIETQGNKILNAQ